MSANEYLIDVFTRHQIFTERFAGGEVKRVDAMIDKLAADLRGIITKTSDDDIRDLHLTRLLKLIRELQDESISDLSEATIKQLEAFGLYEAEFTQRALGLSVNASVSLPSDALIIAAISDTPMTIVSGKSSQTITLEEMFNTFSAKKQTEVSNIIRTAATQGKTGSEIGLEVERVVKNRTKSQTEAIVRTATNHISNQARGVTFSANQDVITGVEWVSILDARTSFVCMGRDGKTYPVDSGPRPPAHYRCRSTITAILNKKFAKPDLTGRRKEGKTETVTAQTTYNSWLKLQSKKMQAEILGADRAQLFRTGKLNVSKFTDPRGVTYSLDQLRQLEPLAFDRAGLV